MSEQALIWCARCGPWQILEGLHFRGCFCDTLTDATIERQRARLHEQKTFRLRPTVDENRLTSGEKLLLFDAICEKLPREWELNENTRLWLLGLIDSLTDALVIKCSDDTLDIQLSGVSWMRDAITDAIQLHRIAERGDTH